MKGGAAVIKHTVKEAEGSIPDNQIGYSVVYEVVSSKDGKVMDSGRYNNYNTCSCSMCHLIKFSYYSLS